MLSPVPASQRKRGFVRLAPLSIGAALLVTVCATGYLAVYLSQQRAPVAATRPALSATPRRQAFTNADYELFIKRIEAGDERGIRAYLDAGLSPNARFGYRGPALFEAIGAGRPDLFPLLVSYGADVNGRNHYDDWTVLAWYIRHGGADQEGCSTNKGRASLKCGDQAIEWLLTHGAKANAQRAGDVIPLRLAASPCGSNQECRMLLAHGARINAREYHYGFTALHVACAQGGEANPCDPENVRLLLDNGADPNVRDTEGKTPLMWLSECLEDFDGAGKKDAARTDDVVAARLLLKYGANVNLKDKRGRTVLEFMREEKRDEYNPKLYAFLKQYAKRHPRRVR